MISSDIWRLCEYDKCDRFSSDFKGIEEYKVLISKSSHPFVFSSFVFFPGGRKVFRTFLRGEYSEENILFWLACEDLKRERNPEMVEEKARVIYEDYVSILSPREVKKRTSYADVQTMASANSIGKYQAPTHHETLVFTL